MALYTIHLDPARTGDAALEHAVLVREGFSWSGFIFSGFWLLWNRLWLGAIAFLVVFVTLSFAAQALGLEPAAASALGILISLFVGFEGRSLQRWKLARRGFRLAAVVGGASEEEAERKAFAALAAQGAAPKPAVPAFVPQMLPERPRGESIIGLFPEPGR
jgi:Protein of unknown function (DUF2628)